MAASKSFKNKFTIKIFNLVYFFYDQTALLIKCVRRFVFCKYHVIVLFPADPGSLGDAGMAAAIFNQLKCRYAKVTFLYHKKKHLWEDLIKGQFAGADLLRAPRFFETLFLPPIFCDAHKWFLWELTPSTDFIVFAPR